MKLAVHVYHWWLARHNRALMAMLDERERRLMATISELIADAKSSTLAAVARVNDRIDELEAKIAADGVTDADRQALADIKDAADGLVPAVVAPVEVPPVQ